MCISNHMNFHTSLTYPSARFATVAPTAGHSSNSSDSSSPPNNGSVPRCNGSTRPHCHQPDATLSNTIGALQCLGKPRFIVTWLLHRPQPPLHRSDARLHHSFQRQHVQHVAAHSVPCLVQRRRMPECRPLLFFLLLVLLLLLHI